MARSALAGLLTACTLAPAADPPPGPTKPMYECLLAGDDARKAAELQKQVAEAEQADKYDAAIKLGEELLALRTRAQGADHWEAVEQEWTLVELRKVAGLPAGTRAGWRKAVRGAAEAQQLEAKGQYPGALPLREEFRRRCEEVLGARHLDTATAYTNLAVNLYAHGRYADAEALFQKALDRCRELAGALTAGVTRGPRGKDEELKLVVPKDPAGADVKPFAHPRYWAAFVLIGDPN